MKRVILSALALVALSSCAKDEGANIEIWNGELRLSSVIETRASGTTWESGDEIGVFMNTTSAPSTAVGVPNTKYATTSETTTATFILDSDFDPLYYPQSGSVDIVAHYPYNESASVSSYPIDLSTKPIDFMSAKMINVSKSSNPLALEFYHLLSQVNVTLTPTGGLSDADLATAIVKIVGTLPAATATIGYDTDEDMPTATFETSGAATTFSAVASSKVASLIVVPQVATISFVITTTSYGSFATTSQSATFTSGDAHAYTISVSRAGATIEGATIKGWGDSGAGDSLEANPYTPAP